MGKFLNLECFKLSEKYPGGCGATEVTILVNGILKNLLIIGMFVAAVMVSYSGWLLFKGAGSPDSRSKAKKQLMNIVVGAIILFGAYFIVNLILTRLGVTDPIIRKSGI